MEPVKRAARQIASGPADTVKHAITRLTAFKGSRGLTGRERSQTLTDVFASDRLHGSLYSFHAW